MIIGTIGGLAKQSTRKFVSESEEVSEDDPEITEDNIAQYNAILWSLKHIDLKTYSMAAGETIRPDSARLPSSSPPSSRNQHRWAQQMSRNCWAFLSNLKCRVFLQEFPWITSHHSFLNCARDIMYLKKNRQILRYKEWIVKTPTQPQLNST